MDWGLEIATPLEDHTYKKYNTLLAEVTFSRMAVVVGRFVWL
jgi:hypothetical protein